MIMELSNLATGRLKDKPMSGLDKGVDMVSVGKFKVLSGVTGLTAVDLMAREFLVLPMLM